MTQSRKLIIVFLCCAGVAWLAGPPGRFLVVLAFLLFGPGYLVERALPVTASSGFLIRPAIWIGLSLSIVALLYQLATLVGFALTTPSLAVLAVAGAAGAIWHVWHTQDAPMMTRQGAETTGIDPLRSPPYLGLLSTLMLLLIFGLTLWTRFVQIQDLALPAWVDSVHHALMIRVVAEQGAAPYVLDPYLPIDNMPYHWGYHVFTAAVMQLSGVELPLVMLWEGQILNALHVLTCAALATYLWRRPLAGLVAALIVGLISIMPAYYVSWGRYTQLAGLLMVPALAIVWHAGLRGTARSWWISAAVLVAGLSIIHFRVLIFACGLLAALSVGWAIDRPWNELRPRIWQAAAAVGLTLVLAAPWLWVVVSQTLFPAIEQPQNLVSAESYSTVNFGILWAGQNRLLVALALVVALWGIARRSRVAVEQVGWVSAMVLFANPWLMSYILPAFGATVMLWALLWRRWLVLPIGIGLFALNPMFVTLPHLWLITNDAVVISLFMPLSVLIGGGVCFLTERLAHSRMPAFETPMVEPSPVALHIKSVPFRQSSLLPVPYVVLVVVLLLALWGTWNSRTVINPSTVFATQADVAAIAWVADNTPDNARFLINATRWLPGVSRGADGGWWLMPLAGRWTSTPPVLFMYGSLDYIREVQARNDKIVGFQTGHEQDVLQIIREKQITHVYLNSRNGPLTPAVFADNTRFEQVYEHDGVTILAVQQ